MSDLVEYREQSPLAVQIEYAQRVAGASMLPDNYRNKPADIMLAVGLGQSMGLSPAESLYRISVIKGKPTASAELIAANVRKAGHRLRVTGDEASATCVIVRADDPDFEFAVTRDLEWATRMGLANNDNYRKQAGTMLQWRAISACARLACPEALYGVVYIPDEMNDMPEDRPGRLASALGRTVTVEQVNDETPGGLSVPPVEGDPEAPHFQAVGAAAETSGESPLLNTSSALAKRMFATMNEAGVSDSREARLKYVSKVLGREIASSTELTDADAETVISATEEALAEPFPAEGAS